MTLVVKFRDKKLHKQGINSKKKSLLPRRKEKFGENGGKVIDGRRKGQK